jgi:hypothetical protein
MSDAWLDQFRGLGKWLGVAGPKPSPELPSKPKDKPRDRALAN